MSGLLDITMQGEIALTYTDSRYKLVLSTTVMSVCPLRVKKLM